MDCCSLLALSCLVASAWVVGAAPSWSYDYASNNGPLDWGKIAGYQACGNGTRQTPIDIVERSTVQRSYDTLAFSSVTGMTSFNLQNDGHGIGGRPVANTPLPTFSGGPLPTEYRIYNYHIHFGNSSYLAAEHSLNGQRTTGEMHVVTYKSSFASIGEAIASGQKDALAVVGYFFQASSNVTGQLRNTVLERTIRTASNLTFNGDSAVISFDFKTLIGPRDLAKYYVYYGSLTTPACSEVVLWMVIPEIIYVTNEQIQSLTSLVTTNETTSFPLFGNTRPIQPLNGRTVWRNFAFSSAPAVYAPSAVFALLVALLAAILSW